MRRVGSEGMDAVSKGAQAAVDELGLLQPLPIRLRPPDALAPRQVHQPQP